MVSKLLPIDFILFLFSDYGLEIVNIQIYLIKYNEILLCMMKQKIFYVKMYCNTMDHVEYLKLKNNRRLMYFRYESLYINCLHFYSRPTQTREERKTLYGFMSESRFQLQKSSHPPPTHTHTPDRFAPTSNPTSLFGFQNSTPHESKIIFSYSTSF